MSHRISYAAADAACDAVAALHDGGTLRIYAGVQPASADTAVTDQVLLGSLAFATPAFDAAVDGVAVANPMTAESNAAAGGSATWFRCIAADGSTVIRDGAVGTSGAELDLDTTTIVTGGSITVITMTLTMPRS